MGEVKTLLLVEDEAIIGMAESKKLKAEGYEVILVTDGETAIETVGAKRDIDLVLMDINLGEGMDGTEAAQRILSRHDLPLLFLSSHTEKEIVQKTEQITNYGYVVKNSSITVLDASIKMAFKLFEAQRKLGELNMEFERANEELRVSLESLQVSNERLARSEDMLAKAFYLNPDAITITRATDGTYLDVNEGFARITGYTREECLGRTSRKGGIDIWAEADAPMRLAGEIARRGYVPDFRAQFRKKDGSAMMGLMSATRVEIGGEPCVLAITKDLSLLESLDAGLKEIADSVPALIAMIDAADLTYTFVNANYERAFGMTRDRIIGTTVRKLLGEESFALALPYIEAARSGRETSYDIYFEVVGGRRLFNVNYKPLFNAAGKVDRIVILNIDITDKARRS
ncbi:MAG TPA: PAS domain S-box protein [Rectinemataceae bacterium]|nr:PAS domain S-box protein [Rectinemataceae bacterium]